MRRHGFMHLAYIYTVTHVCRIVTLVYTFLAVTPQLSLRHRNNIPLTFFFFFSSSSSLLNITQQPTRLNYLPALPVFVDIYPGQGTILELPKKGRGKFFTPHLHDLRKARSSTPPFWWDSPQLSVAYLDLGPVKSKITPPDPFAIPSRLHWRSCTEP